MKKLILEIISALEILNKEDNWRVDQLIKLGSGTKSTTYLSAITPIKERELRIMELKIKLKEIE